MSKLKRFNLLILNIVLYWVSKFIPKNDNIWIFGAWMGDKYADNSKYLFNYVTKMHKEIKCIWLTNSDNIVTELREKGFWAYKRFSCKAIFYALRARVSVFTHSNSSDNMAFMNNKSTKLVQLWHGMPFKKIGFDDTKYTTKDSSWIKNKVREIFFPFLIENYDLVCASSEKDGEKFRSAFRNKNVAITGYARNDSLSMNKVTTVSRIVYLPTFRDQIGSEVDLFTSFGFDVKKWQKELDSKNIKLEIKMHPVNKPSEEVVKQINRAKNITFLDDIDITEYLNNVDMLITDYSSVYFDFLKTGKPIIFAPFDIDDYLRKDRELYYPYSEVTPGPSCKNWDDVLKWISTFYNNTSLYLNERECIGKKFIKYHDFENCNRIFTAIKDII